MKWLLIIASLLAISCSNNKQHEIGQYVYVDGYSVIHVDKKCASQSNENKKTKDERMLANKGIVFTDTCVLKRVGENVHGVYTKLRFCPKCVDDDAYYRLSVIMERNGDEVNNAAMMRDRLY